MGSYCTRADGDLDIPAIVIMGMAERRKIFLIEAILASRSAAPVVPAHGETLGEKLRDIKYSIPQCRVSGIRCPAECQLTHSDGRAESLCG
jgi:hypothetical protein